MGKERPGQPELKYEDKLLRKCVALYLSPRTDEGTATDWTFAMADLSVTDNDTYQIFNTFMQIDQFERQIRVPGRSIMEHQKFLDLNNDSERLRRAIFMDTKSKKIYLKITKIRNEVLEEMQTQSGII